MENIIKINKLGYNYGEGWILHDLSVEIAQGDFVAVIGPNGAGKSTLLRLLAGILQPTSGEIELYGTPLPQFKAWEKIGYVPQNPAKQHRDFPISVKEVIGLGLLCGSSMFQKISRAGKARVETMLERFYLQELAHRKIGELSGGQQQRVALARALVAQPGLLLLDEPLSNLDAKLRESMRFEILSIQKALGITVVYVTHDQGEAMAMSDRVVVMSKGVVQQIGAPHEIYTNPANKMVADFIGLVNFMQGEVSDDRVYLQGTTASFPNTSGVSGSATIAVRPENITMSRGGGMLEGTLTHRFYLGDAVDYRVTVGDHDVRVIVKGADLKEFADGEKVYLDFEKVMIFDRE